MADEIKYSEAAKILGFSYHMVYRLVQSGELPRITIRSSGRGREQRTSRVAVLYYAHCRAIKRREKRPWGRPRISDRHPIFRNKQVDALVRQGRRAVAYRKKHGRYPPIEEYLSWSAT